MGEGPYKTNYKPISRTDVKEKSQNNNKSTQQDTNDDMQCFLILGTKYIGDLSTLQKANPRSLWQNILCGSKKPGALEIIRPGEISHASVVPILTNYLWRNRRGYINHLCLEVREKNKDRKD